VTSDYYFKTSKHMLCNQRLSTDWATITASVFYFIFEAFLLHPFRIFRRTGANYRLPLSPSSLCSSYKYNKGAGGLKRMGVCYHQKLCVHHASDRQFGFAASVLFNFQFWLKKALKKRAS
jgi:hypothetical protein